MMNIFELLSFDISEFFASTEGKLIIAGIICLIIGIVFLCMGNGKNKKDKKGAVTPENGTTVSGTPEVTNTNTVTEPVVEAPAVNNETVPVANQEPATLNENINTNQGQIQNDTTVNSTTQEVPNASPVEPINFGTPTPVTPVEPTTPAVAPEPLNFETPVASTPAVEKLEVTNTIPTMTNVEKEPVITQEAPTPVVTPEPVITPVEAPEPVITPVETPKAPEIIEPTPVTVYGGANPEISKAEVLEEKPREIYGGANPLENTAPIPTNTVKEAYNGAVITPVTPTPAVTPAPTPVVTPEPLVTPVAPTPLTNPTPATTPVTPAPTVSEPAPTPVVTPEPLVTPVAPTPLTNPTPATAPVTPAPVVPEPTPAPVVTPMAPREEIEKLEF